MDGLDRDIIDLMSKRAFDMAGILPGVRVSLNGKAIACNSFDKYIQMYFDPESTIPRIRDKNVDSKRWKVVVTFSGG